MKPHDLLDWTIIGVGVLLAGAALAGALYAVAVWMWAP